MRAGADRPVFSRTVCDSTMCQPPTVGGGSEVRHRQAVLVKYTPSPEAEFTSDPRWGAKVRGVLDA